jgi:hypothetical protein
MTEGDRREWERVIHSPESTAAEREVAQLNLGAADAAAAAHSATVEETIAVDALDGSAASPLDRG